MFNRKRVMIVIPVVAIAAVLAFRLARERSMRDAGTMRVSGNIEITSAQVSFKLPGRVVRRLVSEGESVTNGQVVALLERTELEQEAAMRRAETQAARAVLAELEAGTRPEEIEQAAAALELSRADARRLDSELARQRELFAQKVISPRDFEAAETAAAMASAKVREGEARLTLLKKGPREETIGAARAHLDQARQAVALAETRLGYTTLTSPLDGVVLTEGIEEGEYVVPGTPVVTIGNLRDAWLRAYVNETDLGRVKIGQAVKISTDTYPGKTYEGRLSFIAAQAEFTPKNVQTARERVKLVYRIKVDVANPAQELKPGMPADAVIVDH
ncbi:MAG: efflux RND transporter periplasmic adaptor subunit [Kiritimatiellae bacterium]|nr:efflux RND transporter periplasmic adaptor subunit [Kiritimatiellia bacterium]